MLGSASLQLVFGTLGRRRRVVFSGDLGPKGAPILKDAEAFEEGDLAFLESTYGNRDHKPFPDTVAEFLQIVGRAVERKGKILVPTFAVGRAQLLMVLLAWAFRNRKLPEFPIYLDSPMAIEATEIYRRHPELYDDEMLAFIRERPVEADLARSKTTATADESKALNDVAGPCLIMAGAGMCTAGRILHHLRQNLWKPETTVLIVGYQSEGSLGRQLVEGRPVVSIFGEKVAVRASVHTLGGFSAHAGQSDLLDWFSNMASARPRVCLTHGEDRARQALATQIQQRFGLTASLPPIGESVEL
jgi:metallo-beta-lactamase family protein